jgi:uncharacterized membrane protein YedE/YeeE
MANPKTYMNPYYAGIGLGLVLLCTYVVMGRGIGASGAFTSVVAAGVQAVAPGHAQSNSFYRKYLPANGNPLKDWLVFEVAGVIVGGLISGLLARRVRRTIDRGPGITDTRRLLFALVGGAIMGFGSKLARGCTSGQALTGGAVLSVGSWVFMLAVFASAYAFAYCVRRQWN